MFGAKLLAIRAIVLLLRFDRRRLTATPMHESAVHGRRSNLACNSIDRFELRKVSYLTLRKS